MGKKYLLQSMKRSAGFVTSYHYDARMARIGIIGTGWGARSQVPNFREAGLEVVAIAGSHHDKTSRVAEELGVEAVDDWRALIARGGGERVPGGTPPRPARPT